MANDTSKDFEDLRKDFDSLRKDFAKLTEDLRRSSSERARAGVDAAREQVGQHTDDLADEIAARPFTSVVAAFGVGFVLGKLLDR